MWGGERRRGSLVICGSMCQCESNAAIYPRVLFIYTTPSRLCNRRRLSQSMDLKHLDDRCLSYVAIHTDWLDTCPISRKHFNCFVLLLAVDKQPSKRPPQKLIDTNKKIYAKKKEGSKFGDNQNPPVGCGPTPSPALLVLFATAQSPSTTTVETNARFLPTGEVVKVL